MTNRKGYMIVFDDEIYKEVFPLTHRLEHIADKYIQLNKHSFLVSSKKTPKELYDELSDLVKSGTQFIIFEMTENNCCGNIGNIEKILEFSNKTYKEF